RLPFTVYQKPCGALLERTMKRLRLELKKDTDRSYDVLVGRGILASLHSEIQRLGSFSSFGLVTDEVVRPLVAEPLQDQLRSNSIDTTLIALPPGESAKTIGTVLDLCQQLLVHGFDRRSLLLAVGGGVVGDITGFAAAIYMRGIPYIQVPTTLLAQVDSSLGGKTGVDLPSGKNLLGAFHQPRLVLSDLDVLTTLSSEARRDGFAEIIKAALIEDPELFSILEKEGADLLDTGNPLLETIIAKACEVKCRVVNRDEHESGLRRILNFGHTLGHALEAAANYNISHGHAVAIGMGLAVQLSRQWAGLSEDNADRALDLIQKLGLPTDIPQNIDPETLLVPLEKDKKIQAGICHFVLLAEIGRALIHPIPVENLRRELGNITSQ
ncbi:MAG: 3-dehydroquinate synthase, partial [Syntrophobacteria bacterium]